MNRPFFMLKYVLLAAWLMSTVSCGSKNNDGQGGNVPLQNGNTNSAPMPTGSATTNIGKDPKVICAWLPEFPPAEYKIYTSVIYTCKSTHREELGGGKRLSWTYEPFGTSTAIESLELSVVSNSSAEITQKAEARLVKMAETLWQKSFAKPLPDEIRTELLAAKGKPMTSNKDWSFDKTTIPVNTTVMHTDAGNGISSVRLRFYLPN